MVLGIARQDCLIVGLSAVDDDPPRSSMPLERRVQEALGGRKVPVLAEPAFDCIAVAVNRTVQIHPPYAHFDIRLIDMPLSADGSLTSVKLLQQKQGVVDYPAMNRGMINLNASFGHHLFQIPETQAIGQIPPDAQ